MVGVIWTVYVESNNLDQSLFFIEYYIFIVDICVLFKCVLIF